MFCILSPIGRWSIVRSGTQRVHSSASVGVEMLCDMVELIGEQVPIQVERHGCGLVPEHLLHNLHVRA